MLDVNDSRELQATILALRQAQRDIRLNINKTARQRIRPLWRAEVNARARTRMAQRVIAAGARANATDRGMTLHAATSRRDLRGGLIPTFEWAGVEFGAHNKRVQVRQRSRNGNPYVRSMMINRQFPGRQLHGMIAFDAASETGTALVTEWVHTVVDELRAVDAVEVTPR